MATATASVIGNASGTAYTNRFDFVPSGTTANNISASTDIGYIGEGSFTYKESGFIGIGTTTKTEKYQTKYWIGEQTISAVQIVGKNDTAVYTLNVTQPITIREVNEAMPTITYDSYEGYTTPSPVTTPTGGAFTVTLPTTIGTIEKEHSVTDDSIPWTETTTTKSVANFVKADDISFDEKKSGCDMTYAAKANLYYDVYQRTETEKMKESPTSHYKADYGLVGWLINGVVYAPGAEYEVTGTVVATPRIGVLGDADDWTFLRKDTATIVQQYIWDHDKKTEIVAVQDTNYYADSATAEETYLTDDLFISSLQKIQGDYESIEFIDGNDIRNGKVYETLTQIS